MKNGRILKPINYLLHAFIDFVYPPFCFDCGGKVQNREFFCELCRDLILREPIPAAESFENRPIDTIIPAFNFDLAVIRKSVHALKYSGIPGPSQELLASRLNSMDLPHYDAAVPVPLHWRRQLKRGYNQAEVLADILADTGRCGKVIQPICRTRFTKTQTHKNRWQRKGAMKKVFALKRKHPPINGKTIVIVDDVCTTGSTAQACAQLLKEAGALRVDLLTVGRA